MKHPKALSIIILGALFLVGLRGEGHGLYIGHENVALSVDEANELVWGPGTVDSVEIEIPISAKLSETEGKTLREMEEMVKELGAKLKLAQQTHDQELRRIGAVKFPSQFGLAGKLDTLKDFSEIRWSPRTPSCQSRRFQGTEWFGSTTSIMPNTTTLTDFHTTTLESN